MFFLIAMTYNVTLNFVLAHHGYIVIYLLTIKIYLIQSKCSQSNINATMSPGSDAYWWSFGTRSETAVRYHTLWHSNIIESFQLKIDRVFSYRLKLQNDKYSKFYLLIELFFCPCLCCCCCQLEHWLLWGSYKQRSFP